MITRIEVNLITCNSFEFGLIPINILEVNKTIDQIIIWISVNNPNLI